VYEIDESFVAIRRKATEISPRFCALGERSNGLHPKYFITKVAYAHRLAQTSKTFWNEAFNLLLE
jgi:hypothetical protein